MSKNSRRAKYHINERLYFFTALCFLAPIPLVYYSLMIQVLMFVYPVPYGLYISAALFGLAVVSCLLFLACSRRIYCRLCRVQFMTKMHCTRRHDVPELAGSLRMPLALSLVTKQRVICCPYCGESHLYFLKKGD